MPAVGDFSTCLGHAGTTFFARALGVISTRLLDGVLIVVFGSDLGALVDARTRRQLKAAGLVDLQVVATVTSALLDEEQT